MLPSSCQGFEVVKYVIETYLISVFLLLGCPLSPMKPGWAPALDPYLTPAETWGVGVSRGSGCRLLRLSLRREMKKKKPLSVWPLGLLFAEETLAELVPGCLHWVKRGMYDC